MNHPHKTGEKGEGAADLKRVREDIAALREDLVKLVQSIAREAEDDLPAEARRLYDKLADQGEGAATTIARGREEQPLIARLLAFGIGFIGGSLLRR